VSILRNAAFAAKFRPRYLRDIPFTYFSSVVVQELLAGAHTPRQRRQVAALYEPFERVQRIVTPSHLVWKEVGRVIAVVLEKTPQFHSKLASGLLNDILIALSGRSLGARIVTGNGQDFRLIQQFRVFALEVLDPQLLAVAPLSQKCQDVCVIGSRGAGADAGQASG
jgi:predicted nucleic acid-binding protein